MLKYRLLIIFIFVLTPFWAQSTQVIDSVRIDTEPRTAQEISQEDVQKYLDDPKFDYEVTHTEIGWWKDFKAWVSNILRRIFEAIFGIEGAGEALAVFLRILPYILLAVLLYVLIRFLINNSHTFPFKSKKNEALVELSEEERIIQSEDIGALIQNALSEKNYRLAVRYYYLLILKMLSEKQLIKWQLQKTNHEYLGELQSQLIKNQFHQATNLYDHIWYGDFPLDGMRYQTAEKTFTQLKNAIEKHG